MRGYPTLLWFARGEDPLMPKMVDSARTVDSLMGYMEEQLKISGDWVEPVKKEEEEQDGEEDEGKKQQQEQQQQEQQEQEKKEKETGVEEENSNEEL